ncbi:hypothetical protein CDCA_CDCA01G0411 [Cyanidium caldarium]|uniref:Telomeric single stranded DNA binding POT1/Cdc13 domain-containing protein n=1 Tax=Cyanidium caldarium TaxID=2771 RepID=A0AAV9IQP0_CYACA|nr:hypothetical protein CDCA_CDCA01G0411 [Cyanidium caldarium]
MNTDAARLTHIRSVKPSTCGPAHHYCVRGRVRLRFGDDLGRQVVGCLLEQAPTAASRTGSRRAGHEWEAAATTTGDQILVVFLGRWREECGPLRQHDWVEVSGAAVCEYEALEPLLSRHGMADDEYAHGYCLVLNDPALADRSRRCTRRDPDGSPRLPETPDASVRVLEDAFCANVERKMDVWKQRSLSILPPVTVSTLGSGDWHQAEEDAAARPDSATSQPASPSGRPRRRSRLHHYKSLAELHADPSPSLELFDVYGVVVDARSPRLLRPGLYLTEVQIIDPSVVSADAAIPKVILASFSKDVSTSVPYTSVGDVIRVHRVAKEWYTPAGAAAAEPVLQLKVTAYSSLCLWYALGEAEDASADADLSPGAAPPQMSVYPPHTKHVELEPAALAVAAEMLVWARQFLSQRGFLGNDAYAVKLRELQQAVQAFGHGTARKRYDAVARICERRVDADKVELRVLDDSVRRPLVVRAPTADWIQLCHHAMPVEPGRWARLRDVRIGLMPDGQVQAYLGNGSSVLLFPDWMPEVDRCVLSLRGVGECPLRPGREDGDGDTLRPMEGCMSPDRRGVPQTCDHLMRADKENAHQQVSMPDSGLDEEEEELGQGRPTSRRRLLRQQEWTSSWFGPPALYSCGRHLNEHGRCTFCADGQTELEPLTVREMVAQLCDALDATERGTRSDAHPMRFRLRAGVARAGMRETARGTSIWLEVRDAISVASVPAAPEAHLGNRKLTIRAVVWAHGEDALAILIRTARFTLSGNLGADAAWRYVQRVLLWPRTWIDVHVLAYLPSGVSDDRNRGHEVECARVSAPFLLQLAE